ncbi:hypothetical protein BDZ45DRAFT_741163 [Acephala macrosclerotiorum]|nr:hypothetical protein BDZ45DRAFT_741163 [Acephala macrosclerotiorum]
MANKDPMPTQGQEIPRPASTPPRAKLNPIAAEFEFKPSSASAPASPKPESIVKKTPWPPIVDGTKFMSEVMHMLRASAPEFSSLQAAVTPDPYLTPPPGLTQNISVEANDYSAPIYYNAAAPTPTPTFPIQVCAPSASGSTPLRMERIGTDSLSDNVLRYLEVNPTVGWHFSTEWWFSFDIEVPQYHPNFPRWLNATEFIMTDACWRRHQYYLSNNVLQKKVGELEEKCQALQKKVDKYELQVMQEKELLKEMKETFENAFDENKWKFWNETDKKWTREIAARKNRGEEVSSLEEFKILVQEAIRHIEQKFSDQKRDNVRIRNDLRKEVVDLKELEQEFRSQIETLTEEARVEAEKMEALVQELRSQIETLMEKEPESKGKGKEVEVEEQASKDEIPQIVVPQISGGASVAATAAEIKVAAKTLAKQVPPELAGPITEALSGLKRSTGKGLKASLSHDDLCGVLLQENKEIRKGAMEAKKNLEEENTKKDKKLDEASSKVGELKGRFMAVQEQKRQTENLLSRSNKELAERDAKISNLEQGKSRFATERDNARAEIQDLKVRMYAIEKKHKEGIEAREILRNQDHKNNEHIRMLKQDNENKDKQIRALDQKVNRLLREKSQAQEKQQPDKPSNAGPSSTPTDDGRTPQGSNRKKRRKNRSKSTASTEADAAEQDSMDQESSPADNTEDASRPEVRGLAATGIPFGIRSSPILNVLLVVLTFVSGVNGMMESAFIFSQEFLRIYGQDLYLAIAGLVATYGVAALGTMSGGAVKTIGSGAVDTISADALEKM